MSSPRTLAMCLPCASCMSLRVSSTHSRLLARGSTKWAWPTRTSSPSMIARVRGRRSVTVSPAPGPAADLDGSAQGLHAAADYVHAHAASGNIGDLPRRGEAGRQDQREDLGLREPGGAVDQALFDRAGAHRLHIQAPAIVAYPDQHIGAGVPRREVDSCRWRVCPPRGGPPASQCRDPCCCGSDEPADRSTDRSLSCPAPYRRPRWSVRPLYAVRFRDREPAGGTVRRWSCSGSMRMLIEFSRSADVSRSTASDISSMSGSSRRPATSLRRACTVTSSPTRLTSWSSLSADTRMLDALRRTARDARSPATPSGSRGLPRAERPPQPGP